MRRCKIEDYTILRVQTLGLPKSGRENVFLLLWKESLPAPGSIFLMSRFKSTRVSGNVIIRLGGRVMKNLILLIWGHPWSPWYPLKKLQATAGGVFPWEATHWVRLGWFGFGAHHSVGRVTHLVYGAL